MINFRKNDNELMKYNVEDNIIYQFDIKKFSREYDYKGNSVIFTFDTSDSRIFKILKFIKQQQEVEDAFIIL